MVCFINSLNSIDLNLQYWPPILTKIYDGLTYFIASLIIFGEAGVGLIKSLDGLDGLSLHLTNYLFLSSDFSGSSPADENYHLTDVT